MKYLLVVAHPDDETLGAGASMWKWSREGHTVDVCIMCTEAKARAFRPSDEELGDDTNESNKFLGVNRIFEGTFPNIEMNTVPHLKLVQFIEAAIKESEPDHHSSSCRHEQRSSSDFDGLPGGNPPLSAPSGSEACKGVLVYGSPFMYRMED